MQFKSLYINVTENDTLHLKRVYEKPDGKPVLMIHGSVENGKIFYSEKKAKGLAPYLARQGYDVYVPDLRGRGLSKPTINKHNNHTQNDLITQDIPACINKIEELKGKQLIHAIGHSWGGVLLLAYFARFNDLRLKSFVFFGTKRRITVQSFEKFWKINLAWRLLGNLYASTKGYLPAKQLKMGSDNEPRGHFRNTDVWIRKKAWIDTEDGFNYGEALKKVDVPPTLYMTGSGDTLLGNPQDVKVLMAEVGRPHDKFLLVGKENGNQVDYDHINILTHPKAPDDHFPLVVDWIKEHSFTPQL